MEKPGDASTETVEATPLPDPLGILQDLTNGRFYDPVRLKIRQKVHEKILGLAKSLED
jgi:hypothetical protein